MPREYIAASSRSKFAATQPQSCSRRVARSQYAVSPRAALAANSRQRSTSIRTGRRPWRSGCGRILSMCAGFRARCAHLGAPGTGHSWGRAEPRCSHGRGSAGRARSLELYQALVGQPMGITPCPCTADSPNSPKNPSPRWRPSSQSDGPLAASISGMQEMCLRVTI